MLASAKSPLMTRDPTSTSMPSKLVALGTVVLCAISYAFYLGLAAGAGSSATAPRAAAPAGTTAPPAAAAAPAANNATPMELQQPKHVNAALAPAPSYAQSAARIAVEHSNFLQDLDHKAKIRKVKREQKLVAREQELEKVLEGNLKNESKLLKQEEEVLAAEEDALRRHDARLLRNLTRAQPKLAKLVRKYAQKVHKVEAKALKQHKKIDGLAIQKWAPHKSQHHDKSKQAHRKLEKKDVQLRHRQQELDRRQGAASDRLRQLEGQGLDRMLKGA